MTNVSQADFLAHYGVKGMKWGKRKQAALESNTRLAKGEGTKKDKLKLGLTVSGLELLKARGSGARIAQMRMNKLVNQKSRMESGQATLRDKLETIGSKSLVEILREE